MQLSPKVEQAKSVKINTRNYLIFIHLTNFIIDNNNNKLVPKPEIVKAG